MTAEEWRVKQWWLTRRSLRESRMSALIFDEDSARERIRERIYSSEWWLFLPAPGCEPYVTAIEERFYNGEASADLELIFFPGRALGPGLPLILGLFFGRKSRASPKDLAPYVTPKGRTVRETERDLAERDLLMLGPPEELQPVAVALHRWVTGHD